MRLARVVIEIHVFGSTVLASTEIYMFGSTFDAMMMIGCGLVTNVSPCIVIYVMVSVAHLAQTHLAQTPTTKIAHNLA